MQKKLSSKLKASVTLLAMVLQLSYTPMLVVASDQAPPATPQEIAPAPQPEPAAPVTPAPQPEPAAPVTPAPQPEPAAPVIPAPQPEPAAPVTPAPQPEPAAPVIPAPQPEPAAPVTPAPQPEQPVVPEEELTNPVEPLEEVAPPVEEPQNQTPENQESESAQPEPVSTPEQPTTENQPEEQVEEVVEEQPEVATTPEVEDPQALEQTPGPIVRDIPDYSFVQQADGSYTTAKNVSVGSYVYPEDDNIIIRFTQVTEPGTITMHKYPLTAEEQAALGSVYDFGLEITSTMNNGSFLYNLTLPRPEGRDVSIKYSENNQPFEDVDSELSLGSSIIAVAMDHFTDFIITEDMADYTAPGSNPVWNDTYVEQTDTVGDGLDSYAFPEFSEANETVTWDFSSVTVDEYDVYITWVTQPNRSDNVRYVLNHLGGNYEFYINQELLADQTTPGANGQDSGQFFVGTFDLDDMSSLVMYTSDNASGVDYTIADDVFLYSTTPVGPGANPLVAIQGRTFIDLGNNGLMLSADGDYPGGMTDGFTVRLYDDAWMLQEEQTTRTTGNIGQYAFQNVESNNTYYVCGVSQVDYLESMPALGQTVVNTNNVNTGDDASIVANNSGAADEQTVCWQVNLSGANDVGFLGIGFEADPFVAPVVLVAPYAPMFITRLGDGVTAGRVDMTFTQSASSDVVYYQYEYVAADLDGNILGSNIIDINPVCDGTTCTWNDVTFNDARLNIHRIRAVDADGNVSEWSNYNDVDFSTVADGSFTYMDYVNGTGVFADPSYIEANGGFAIREQILPQSNITTPGPVTTDQPSITIDYTAWDIDTAVKQVDLYYDFNNSGTYTLVDTQNAMGMDAFTLDGSFDFAFPDGAGTYCFYTIAEDIADDLLLDNNIGNREDAVPCAFEVTYTPPVDLHFAKLVCDPDAYTLQGTNIRPDQNGVIAATGDSIMNLTDASIPNCVLSTEEYYVQLYYSADMPGRPYNMADFEEDLGIFPVNGITTIEDVQSGYYWIWEVDADGNELADEDVLEFACYSDPANHAGSLTNPRAAADAAGQDGYCIAMNADELYSITGEKYDAISAAPVEGWEISLIDMMGNVIETQATAADGSYSFEDLTAGLYYVCEAQMDPWVQVYPFAAGDVPVDIDGNLVYTLFDSVVAEQPAFASQLCWNVLVADNDATEIYTDVSFDNYEDISGPELTVAPAYGNFCPLDTLDFVGIEAIDDAGVALDFDLYLENTTTGDVIIDDVLSFTEFDIDGRYALYSMEDVDLSQLFAPMIPDGLEPGTYWFSITAYDNFGNSTTLDSDSLADPITGDPINQPLVFGYEHCLTEQVVSWDPPAKTSGADIDEDATKDMTVLPTDQVQYELTLTYTGLIEATVGEIIDEMDPGLTYVANSVNISGVSDADYTINEAIDADTNTITWTFGGTLTVQPGEVITLTYTAQVDENASGILINTVSFNGEMDSSRIRVGQVLGATDVVATTGSEIEIAILMIVLIAAIYTTALVVKGQRS